MIGDWMGLLAVYAAMTVSDHPLYIERCNIVGLQKHFLQTIILLIQLRPELLWQLVIKPIME
jgi:hypothetical protein